MPVITPAIGTVMSDTTLMYIDWYLLDDKYYPQSGEIVHTPDLLRKMADNLSLLNADFYQISIRGKEHPFYYNIIEYLVLANMPVCIEAEIDLGENGNEWARILTKVPPNKIRFKLSIPANPEIYKSSLEAIAFFAASGQTVVVTPANNERLNTILKKFQQTVEFEIVGSVSEEEKFHPSGISLPAGQYASNTGSDSDGTYCHMGESYYSITPSGHLLTANCEQGIDLGPFWKLCGEDLAALPLVMKCHNGECPHSRIFSRQQNCEVKKRAVSKPDPMWMLVLSELEQLEAAHIGAQHGYSIKRGCEHLFFTENRELIIDIYRHFADRESRNSFLHSLLSAITGSKACLKKAYYPKEEHPVVKSRAEDVQFWEEGRYCQWFAPKTPIALTNRLEAMLKLHLPKVAIPINSESLFAIPKQLIELGYELYWGWHGDDNLGIVYGCHPEQMQSTHNSVSSHDLISIIVPFYNNADTIRRCILSACVQGYKNFEVIAIDDGSTDDSASIVSELAAMWPKHIRLKRLGKNMGPGYARNFGMSIATGEFMTFIDADDALAPDFLRKSLDIMKAQKADIVAFDLLHIQKGKYPKVWDVKEGVYSGWDSLEQLLFKNAGRYATYSRLYRTEFLRKNNVRYSNTRVHQDIFFSILAFFYSSKTVVVPEIGYLRFQRPGVSHAAGYHGAKQLEAFASFVRFMNDLFESNGLDKDSDAYKYCIRRLYTWDRDRMYRAIREVPLDDAIIRVSIANIGYSMEALKLVLHDYAMAHISHKSDVIRVLPVDRDWKKAAAQPPAEVICEAYRTADTHWNKAPDISIIIPSYNSGNYIRACLDSIYAQDFSNIEVIILDDASTDESYDILREEANSNNKIRLYRLKNNCRQGIARNIGLEKANGKYIIFVDADDICLPGFFKDAYRAIENTQADIVFFSSELEGPNGNTWRRPFESEKALSRSEALTAFWEERLGVEPWAKIFRTSTLKMHKCKFPLYIYHQDVPFLFDALNSCQKIIIKPKNVYRRRYSENSTIRPKTANYLQINSAYTFYWLINRAACSSPGVYKKKNLPFVKWNLENVLLDKIAAYVRAINDVPMTSRDYDLLKKNENFLAILMQGAASIIPEEADFRGKIETQFRSVSTWHGEGIEPLATVIIFCNSAHRNVGSTRGSALGQSMAWLEIVLAPDTDISEDDLEIAPRDARIRLLDTRRREFSIENVLTDCSESVTKFTVLSRAGYRFEPDMFMVASAIMEMDESIQGAIPVKRSEGAANIPDKFKADYLTMSGTEVAEAILMGWIDVFSLLGTLWRKSFLKEHGANIDKRNILPWLFKLCGKASSVTLYKVDNTPLGENTKQPSLSEIVEILGIANDLVEGNPSLGIYLKVERNRRFIDTYLACLLTRAKDIPETGPGETVKNYLATLAHMSSIIRILLENWTKSEEDAKIGVIPTILAPIKPDEHLIPIAGLAGTDKPLLSLIVYAYNTEEPINEILISLVEQCRREVEIILIDDGSQIANHQGYRYFCEKIACYYDVKISIFETLCHSGQAVSWKLGLEKSTGEYVAFMRLGEALPDGWVAEALERDNGDVAFWGQPATSRRDAILKLLKNEIGAGVYQLKFIKERAQLEGGIAFANITFPLLALFDAKHVVWHSAMLPPHDAVQVFGFEQDASLQDTLKTITTTLELLKSAEQSGELIKAYVKRLFQPGSGGMQWLLDVIHQGIPDLDASIFNFCSDDTVFLELIQSLARVRSAEIAALVTA